MNRRDAFRILGLSPGASQEDIKTAWKKAAKKYHPDVSDLENAEQKFKLAGQAYEKLSNNKQEVENYWEDLKEERLREARKLRKKEKKVEPYNRKIKPEPLHIGSVIVPVECFLIGDPSFIDITITKPCSDCFGNKEDWISCKICDQTGFVFEYDMFAGVRDKKCSQCKGQGWIRKHRCRECKGSLQSMETKKLEIKIPRNYAFKRNLLIEEEGNKGWNCEDGDVYVQLRPDLKRLFLSDKEKDTLRSLLNK